MPSPWFLCNVRPSPTDSAKTPPVFFVHSEHGCCPARARQVPLNLAAKSVSPRRCTPSSTSPAGPTPPSMPSRNNARPPPCSFWFGRGAPVRTIPSWTSPMRPRRRTSPSLSLLPSLTSPALPFPVEQKEQHRLPGLQTGRIHRAHVDLAPCPEPPPAGLFSVGSAAAAVSLSNKQARTPAPSPACSIPCFRTESSNDAAAR